MASNRPAAKTPTVAIARVLRDLGLKQGQDFRVKGEYRRGERIGTYVVLYSKAAEERVSVQRDVIEQRTAAEGFPFNVSVYYSKTGYRGVHVANFGTRVRETGPAT